MEYLEFNIQIQALALDHAASNEILIAELGAIGFDSFVEKEGDEEGKLSAYIPKELFVEETLIDIQKKYEQTFQIEYDIIKIPKTNWNQKWEDNYDPIFIEDQCIIKASFHKDMPSYPYEITINPKMSFGTGHHETTTLMLTHLLNMDIKDNSVLDAGCGTGVLAILAYLKGAKSITAYDIDEWSVENTLENFEINKVQGAKLFQGTVKEVGKKNEFNIILANINKNILLDEMYLYIKHLTPNGVLMLSGFYENDIPDLVAKANTLGLSHQKTLTKNHWSSIVLQ